MNAVWEFGTLQPGTELRRRFTITNPMTRPWTIKYVTKSCACSAGEFSSRTVGPRETTWLEVVFRAPDREGPIHHSIVVDFAEPEAPTTFLVMKGEVRRLLSAVPPRLDFGRLAPGERPAQEVEVKHHGLGAIALARVEAPEWLRVEVHSPDPNGQAWKLTIRPTIVGLKPGPRAATVVVYTCSHGVGPLLIPVSLQVKAPVDAVPESFAFGAVAVGETTERSLLLEVGPELAGLSAKDLVVTHNLGAELEVRVTKLALPQRFLVVGQFRPTRARGTVEGRVEIGFRQATAAPLSVRVTGEVP